MAEKANIKKKNERPNWAEGRWKKMIVEQRKFLWSEDLLPVYARWMGLKQGMTAVDVGCGLGYLGYTYWPFFGKEGKYIGIDISEDLLRDAEIGAQEWAKSGESQFIKGNVYKIPLPDRSVDWVMCQTLMMHLGKPEKALKEMIRILKPGGLFMCKEPDNLTGSLSGQYQSWNRLKVDDQIRLARYHMLCSLGRKKLGYGDDTIGNKIPMMLSHLNMTEIDIRMNDKVWFMQPPYNTPQQKQYFKNIKENLTDSNERKYWMNRAKDEFLAGGGTIEDFEWAKKIMKKMRAVGRKQFRENNFSSCSGGFFYIIKARRPLRMRKK